MDSTAPGALEQIQSQSPGILVSLDIRIPVCGQYRRRIDRQR